ncbi:MAG: HAD-IIA family hydrolase [Firmicutes bacterium]|nr:HAD-IIA family hydrolase [Bacillota bacterium]
MKCFCLDLDGTLYRGDTPIEYAAEFTDNLNKKGVRYIALTNCPLRSADEISRKLRGMGITIPRDRILTSGMAAAALLAERGISRVYAVGSEALRQECADRGIVCCDDAQAVLIGYSRDICFNDIKKACLLVQKGAALYCTNGDAAIPDGEYSEPHTGAVAAAVEYATGKNCFYIGKPEPYMLPAALEMLQCEPQDIIVVGDRPDTDIAFAKNCGTGSCLVLTGQTDREEADRCLPWPDYVFNNLKELEEQLL